MWQTSSTVPSDSCVSFEILVYRIPNRGGRLYQHSVLHRHGLEFPSMKEAFSIIFFSLHAGMLFMFSWDGLLAAFIDFGLRTALEREAHVSEQIRDAPSTSNFVFIFFVWNLEYN